ncbi:AraC family transcriptional regulator [Paraburkholderia sacchari]|uniref:AraC family transcriptional regulator n=1 Tax=Paraburkholderia sacchari TaxID=159450 RepID=UPI0039A6351C
MGNLTRSASLTDYEHVARAAGLDPLRMLKLARLPARALDDPNLMISIDSVGWLLEESARLSGQEAFGLLLAETRSLSNFGMLALVLRDEPTVRAAMHSFARYMRLHNAGVQPRVEEGAEITLLHVEMQIGRGGLWRQATEMSVGIGIRALRTLTHDTFRPVKISFSHQRPRSLEVHRRVLGTPMDFSQEVTAIVCRSRDLDKPIPAADPKLSREVKRWLDMQLAELGDQPLDRARQIIKILLPTGACTVERVAEHLGMHRRTLNRHLAASGESVTSVVGRVRAELAEEYLSGGTRKLYEVADLLGFGSGADFSRWFRTRFGVPPSEWVARRREDAATEPKEPVKRPRARR